MNYLANVNNKDLKLLRSIKNSVVCLNPTKNKGAVTTFDYFYFFHQVLSVGRAEVTMKVRFDCCFN